MAKVSFRDFEERDIDFIFRCKNDESLNSMTVGEYHPFSYEEAAKWVHGCMGEHETYKFWAVCTNDDEKRIVGWVSLSDINYVNKSAFFHGIVIADKMYNDGTAWMESHLFIYDYVFEKLHFNRLSGSCLLEQKASLHMNAAMLNQYEGVARKAVYKNGVYHDVVYSSLLRDEYERYLDNGDYEMRNIIRRLYRARKEKGEKVVVLWKAETQE